MLERAWAAGFFDGEGSLGRRQRKNGSWLHQIQVVQSLPFGFQVLLRFQNAVEVGKIYGPYGPYKGNRKLYHTWSVSGLIECVSVIRKIYPYLSVQKRADVFNNYPELVL